MIILVIILCLFVSSECTAYQVEDAVNQEYVKSINTRSGKYRGPVGKRKNARVPPSVGTGSFPYTESKTADLNEKKLPGPENADNNLQLLVSQEENAGLGDITIPSVGELCFEEDIHKKQLLDFTDKPVNFSSLPEIEFNNYISICPDATTFTVPWPDAKFVKKSKMLSTIQNAVESIPIKRRKLNTAITSLLTTSQTRDGLQSYLLFICYLGKGDYQKAQKSLIEVKNIREFYRTNIFWWIYFYIGRLYLIEGDYTSALSSFDKAIEAEPDQQISYIYKGRVYQSEKKYDDAIAVYTQALKMAKNKIETMYITVSFCSVYAELKKWDSILSLTNPYVTDKDASAWLIRYHCLALEKTGQQEKIYQVLKKRIEFEPDDDLWIIYLARFYWKNDRKKDACSLLESAYHKNKSNFNTGMRLAQYYAMSGKSDDAIKVLDELIAKKPHQPQPFLLAGKIYTEKKDYTKAIEYFQKVIKINPNIEAAYYLLGKVYQETDQHKKMDAIFKRYLRLFPAGKNTKDIKEILEKASATRTPDNEGSL